MNAAEPNFFLLLLLGAAVTHGLAPAYGIAFLILAFLWLFTSHPLLALALAVAWLLRWFIVDFFFALIGGYGFGLGLREAGFREPRRSIRRRWWL